LNGGVVWIVVNKDYFYVNTSRKSWPRRQYDFVLESKMHPLGIGFGFLLYLAAITDKVYRLYPDFFRSKSVEIRQLLLAFSAFFSSQSA
jgi:hypothetical protein